MVCSGGALSRERFQPVTVYPACINRGTIRAPIVPSPTNPIFTTRASLLLPDGRAGAPLLADIGSLTASKHLKLVAVAEVDLGRTAEVRKRFPDVKVYQDWRELLDKEKGLDSVNVSTPDHAHAPITMRAMQQGLHVYTQKPLTQTIYEARQLTKVANDNQLAWPLIPFPQGWNAVC